MIMKLDMIRVRNIVNLMKNIRIEEDTEIFSGDLWKSLESIREDTRVYHLNLTYPGLLIDTGRGYIFVRRERLYVGDYTDTDIESCVDVLATPDGVYAAHLRLEDWTGSDFVEYAFNPSDYDTFPCAFAGGFMDACRFIIDWMS